MSLLLSQQTPSDAVVVSVADVGKASAVVSVVSSNSLSVAANGRATCIATAIVLSALAVADVGRAAEVVQVRGVGAVAVADAGRATEVVQVRSGAALAVADVGRAAEVVQVRSGAALAVADAGRATEVVQVQEVAALAVADAGRSSEIVQVQGASALAVADAGHSSEIVQVQGVGALAVADAGRSSEIVQVESMGFLSVFAVGRSTAAASVVGIAELSGFVVGKSDVRVEVISPAPPPPPTPTPALRPLPSSGGGGGILLPSQEQLVRAHRYVDEQADRRRLDEEEFKKAARFTAEFARSEQLQSWLTQVLANGRLGGPTTITDTQVADVVLQAIQNQMLQEPAPLMKVVQLAASYTALGFETTLVAHQNGKTRPLTAVFLDGAWAYADPGAALPLGATEPFVREKERIYRIPELPNPPPSMAELELRRLREEFARQQRELERLRKELQEAQQAVVAIQQAQAQAQAPVLGALSTALAVEQRRVSRLRTVILVGAISAVAIIILIALQEDNALGSVE